MSAVEDIINYKRSPDEDFYKLLNSDENSSVSGASLQTHLKKTPKGNLNAN